ARPVRGAAGDRRRRAAAAFRIGDRESRAAWRDDSVARLRPPSSWRFQDRSAKVRDMRIFRRFAMLCALGWWLGGLTFYATVVIRAGHQVIGSHAKVGFITQKATAGLNWIGAAALALMVWNAAASWRAAGSWP